jgi:hypothetical protein
MVCMEHFQHFRKERLSFKIGVSYASCGPTSCQDGCKESEIEDVVSIYKVNLVHSCQTSSFIYPKQSN